MSPGYQKPLRAINFHLPRDAGAAVSLVGDFNHWDPTAHPMKRMPDRSWLVT